MAVQHYEELMGEEVDVEEGAIATAFKKVADEELKQLFSVVAVAQANHLPVTELLDDYRHTLESIQSAASDDGVRILAGEGKSFKESRDTVRKIRQALNDVGLATLRQARAAVEEIWPELAPRDSSGELRAKADELRTLIHAISFFEQLERMAPLAHAITAVYQDAYVKLHERRTGAFERAIEEIKGRAEWNLIDKEGFADILEPLSSRACNDGEDLRRMRGTLLEDAALRCRFCNASLGQIESDLAAVGGLKAQVIARIQQMIAPKEKIERVKLSEFFTEALDSREAVHGAIERLHEYLLKLLAEDVTIILE